MFRPFGASIEQSFLALLVGVAAATAY